jgi:hypothetical protein
LEHLKIKIKSQELENVEYFNYFGCMIKNYACFTSDTKVGIATKKPAFNRKKTLFAKKLDLNLRKTVVKCYIWSTALYGAETWARLKADEKYQQSFEIWCWRKWRRTFRPIM